MTRARAIAAKCRDCIHDPEAAGTWREQVGACACTGCPLWRFRPLPRRAPQWLASRSPNALPSGFRSQLHDDAIRTLRSEIDAKAANASVRAHGGAYVPPAATGVLGVVR